jgi:hypothetical protein
MLFVAGFFAPLMPMRTAERRPHDEDGGWFRRRRRRKGASSQDGCVFECRYHVRRELHGGSSSIRQYASGTRIGNAAFYGIYEENSCIAVEHSRKRHSLGSKHIRWQSQSLTFAILLEILLFVILLAIVAEGTPTYNFCYSQLTRADSNGDSTIDSTEWELFVGFVSGGTAVSTSLDKTSLFTTAGGTDSISIAAVQDSASNNVFCQSVYEGVLSASSMQLDTSETRCLYAMSIGDADRDSSLARLIEYPRYANQVSGNIFGFGTAYDELPALVQAVFDEFVDDTSTDTIDLFGAKSSETLSTEQASKLKLFCQQTAIAIIAASGGDSSVTTPMAIPVASPQTSAPVAGPIAEPAPAPAPTASPGTASQVAAPVAVPVESGSAPIADGFVSSFTSAVCLQQIAFSDSSRDNTLSSSEYYGFLNRLTEDSFAQSGSFENLPEPLRTTFASLAGGSESGTVNVYGSKPGQTASQDDSDRLNQFCTATDVAVQQVMANDGGIFGDTPVVSPTDGSIPTPSTTSSLSFEECTKTMIVADLSRDSLLNGKEFVRFLSKLDDSIQESDALSALHQSLQVLFTTLAVVNGEIDVTGSKPNETPTSEQESHLESVCNQVGVALAALAVPSTLTPTTVLTGQVTIYNAFIIYNSVHVTALALKSNQADWDGFNQAYTVFVQNAVSNFTAANPASGELTKSWKRLRYRRHLPVSGIVKDSPRLYLINDTDCPETVNQGDVCNVVFASFDVEFVDMNQDNVVEALTNYTQSLLYPILEAELLSKNPNSVFRIAGPNAILRPPETDTSTPVTDGAVISEDEGSGPNVVQIIGGIVIICILIGCPLYYWKTRHSRGKPKVKKSDPSHDVDGSDERENDKVYRVESAPPYGSCSPFDNSSKENHDVAEDESLDDDETIDPSEEQQFVSNDDQHGKAEGKKFKPFRLGKKKDFAVDDDIGILESNDGLPDGVDDFGNYEYEEPIETWEHHNVDSDWGESQWGIVTSDAQKNDRMFDSLAIEQSSKKNEDVHDETEWSGSLSESSGSNSEFGNGSAISGASGNVGHLGGLVDNGQWNGVMQTAAQIENNLSGSVSSHNSDFRSHSSNKSATETSYDREIVNDFVDDPFDDRTQQTGSSMTSEEQRRREAYRVQIEDLVRKAAPDEIGNVKNMMDQFVGREAELINTLQTMLERSVSQSRLKAVHKSKAIRERDAREFTSGGAESSAVVAAASMITGEDDVDMYDDEGVFEGDSYYDDNLEESADGTRSYDDNDDDGAMEDFDYDEEGDEQSYGNEDDDQSYYSRSYDDGDGSRSRGGSFDDESRSHSERYDDGSRSRSASYDEGSRSRSASYDDEQDGSAYRSHGEPYDDDFDGSGSGSRSESYVDNDGFDDIERSFTGSRSGSGSKERSYVYDDGDGSYYSDEE